MEFYRASRVEEYKRFSPLRCCRKVKKVQFFGKTPPISKIFFTFDRQWILRR